MDVPLLFVNSQCVEIIVLAFTLFRHQFILPIMCYNGLVVYFSALALSIYWRWLPSLEPTANGSLQLQRYRAGQIVQLITAVLFDTGSYASLLHKNTGNWWEIWIVINNLNMTRTICWCLYILSASFEAVAANMQLMWALHKIKNTRLSWSQSWPIILHRTCNLHRHSHRQKFIVQRALQMTWARGAKLT